MPNEKTYGNLKMPFLGQVEICSSRKAAKVNYLVKLLKFLELQSMCGVLRGTLGRDRALCRGAGSWEPGPGWQNYMLAKAPSHCCMLHCLSGLRLRNINSKMSYSEFQKETKEH